jgi:hypothetical protein
MFQASKEHRMKKNCISTLKIYPCGFIYISGLQTPQLTSLHIQLRATDASMTEPKESPQMQDTAHSPCTLLSHPLHLAVAELECISVLETKNHWRMGFLNYWVFQGKRRKHSNSLLEKPQL